MEWYWILTIVLGSTLLLFLLSWLLYKPFFKRFWDVVLSGLAIIVLSPILLILSLLGLIFMKGNPFFTQKRPGKNEKIFKLIKFRSMNNNRDRSGNLLPDGQRLSKYGRILRSTSLDELPELFNIFVGDMSIVGPRPLLIEYLPWYSESEKHRHDIRPGLTGWAQVCGRNNLDWNQRFEHDVFYVSHLSLLFDIKILFLTAVKVFKKDSIQVDTDELDGNMADIRKKESQGDTNA